MAFPNGWRAMSWLESQVNSFQGDSPDELAESLANELTEVFWANTGEVLQSQGLGLHFTFYDKVNELMVPELIWITNFNSITALGQYKPEHGPGFVAHRQTFHTISKTVDYENHRKSSYREVVANYLSQVSPLSYQNGDLGLTEPTRLLAEQMIVNLIIRKELKTTDPLETFGLRALYRAEVAALTQKVFSTSEKIGVGAPCFNLIIPPEGPMSTQSGPILGLTRTVESEKL